MVSIVGMPKLLLRQHEFILRQSKCLSASFEKSVKNIYQAEERDTSIATNLAVFPLHYLKVSFMLFVQLAVYPFITWSV